MQPASGHNPASQTRECSSASSTSSSSVEPIKYVRHNGFTQLNPEWQRWKQSRNERVTTVQHPREALAVVSTIQDHNALQAAARQAGEVIPTLSSATEVTMQIFQEPEVAQRVGLGSDDIIASLSAVFRKYEAPIGLMNKLFILSEFDWLEFIVDDSGSMSSHSDTKDARGRVQTRFEEAKSRLKAMFEIMAYVPMPEIRISFFNRRNIIILHHKGETPERFIELANRQIDESFRGVPGGSTPVRERLAASFEAGRGKRIARYLFCDGQPDGGDGDKERITSMLKNRENPEGNPFTFLSCSDQDHEVEWMKEAEELAPFCAEYDDFVSEAKEVHGDQGPAIPYTYGFHLIGQIVGAMNPDDLDAMDESIPFTRFTIENLLGVQVTDQEYEHYFNGFVRAQEAKSGYSKLDQIKRSFNWRAHRHEFQYATTVARNLTVVQEFKRQLEHVAPQTTSSAPVYNDDGCIIC